MTEENLFDRMTFYDKMFFLENCTDAELTRMCSLSKEWDHLCYHSKTSEYIFEMRSLKNISKEILELKSRKMSWKDFYIRVYKFQKRPLNVNFYCKRGDLLEVQLYANLTPPIYPTTESVNYVCRTRNIELLKFLVSRGVLPNQHGADGAARQGSLEILKYLVSLSPKILPTELGFISAIQFGKIEIVKYLLSLDINLDENLIAHAKNTARNFNQKEILALLE